MGKYFKINYTAPEKPEKVEGVKVEGKGSSRMSVTIGKRVQPNDGKALSNNNNNRSWVYSEFGWILVKTL